jgi:parvulin-like peptidyl-prolyl isomerase
VGCAGYSANNRRVLEERYSAPAISSEFATLDLGVSFHTLGAPGMRLKLILLAGAFLAVGIATVPGEDTLNADGIEAIVNTAIITTLQVKDAVDPLADLLIRQYRSQPDVLQAKILSTRREKLEELVDRQLILYDFESSEYKLPESIVDDIVNERIKQRYGDRATFTKTLQAQGKTFEAYRREQREQIIIDALNQRNLSAEKVLISPQKIERFYNDHQTDFKLEDQVKVRMIALNVTSGNPIDEVRKLGAEILQKIDAGAPFAEMASVYSEGSTRAQGGDRGWVDRSFFNKELTDVAFGLKPGQHSGLVEMPSACYILMVEDARVAHVKPLAEVRDEVEATLKAQEKNRLKKKWIDRIKNKAFVRYFVHY